MATRSSNDLTLGALQLLSVVESSESLSASDASLGLTTLNDMLEGWGLQPQTLRQVSRVVVPLAIGTPYYAIGSGETIDVGAPDSISRANLILDDTDTPNTEVPIAVLGDDQWAAISQKASTSSQVVGVYLDRRGNGADRVYPWPIPTVSTMSLVLYLLTGTSQFANKTTQYVLPQGWSRAIKYNLALELAPAFDAIPSAKVERIAGESLDDIKRSNFRPRELNTTGSGSATGGRYNVFTDS